MSISVYPMAVRDDVRSAEMASIYRMCKKNKIELPDEVQEFFGYTDPPDDNAATVDIKGVRKWSDNKNARDFQEFDVSALPPGTKRIRIVISY
jgi:hypothetical protein